MRLGHNPFLMHFLPREDHAGRRLPAIRGTVRYSQACSDIALDAYRRVGSVRSINCWEAERQGRDGFRGLGLLENE